jgi:hypothetical protein
MTDAVRSLLATIHPSDLRPFVSQVLDKPNLEVIDWQVQPLLGGAANLVAGGVGVYRLSGSARDTDGTYPWTLIVKIASGSSATAGATPNDWNYWKREVLAYQSGLLLHLLGNLVAPRCYGVTEHPNNECRIWLEDIHESASVWGLERHGIAARHLGQFNGAYLSGISLPVEQPWMLRGRTQHWIEWCNALIDNFPARAHTDMWRPWLTDNIIERILKLWTSRQLLLQSLYRLPVCFCHHDAFRRNLFARDTAPDVMQTVAIDWSHLGYGGVGQEAGSAIAVDLLYLEVDAKQAKLLDTIMFESYVDGLQDAGWRGDVRLARFGYTAAASLDFGVMWAIIMTDWMSTNAGAEAIAAIIGHPLDEIVTQWAEAQVFLLNLGDEALRLMDVVAAS